MPAPIGARKILKEKINAVSFSADPTLPLLLLGAVITLFLLLLVPLPRFVIDLLIVANITFTLASALTALLAREVKMLFLFPTIVLVATLFRLAITVSSTRLILLYGDQGLGVAGDVIRVLGTSVVREDFLVGITMFAIIAIANALVIARGAARVAEVQARFVLDALPGKQLAIDADLRSGLISKEDASRRRQALNQESQFYGSMDGSMRFVQGDAIATLVITLLNAFGGMLLGMQRGLKFDEALSSFGILAVGEGLVNILPALLMTISTGFVVTKISDQEDLVREGSAEQHVFKVFDNRSLQISGFAAVIFGLLPGVPLVPFFIVGLTLLFMSFRAERGSRSAQQYGTNSMLIVPPATTKLLGTEEQGVLALPQLALIGLKLATPFAQTIDLDRLRSDWSETRLRVAHELGLNLPEVVVEIVNQTQTDYQIAVREVVADRGILPKQAHFVVAPLRLADSLALEIVPGPGTFNLPQLGFWTRTGADACQRSGAKVLASEGFLAEQIAAVSLNYIDELLTLDYVQKNIEQEKLRSPKMIEELFLNSTVKIAEVTEVLRALVKERVSIRDLGQILEAFTEFATRHDRQELGSEYLFAVVEFIRKRCARSIVSPLVSQDATLRAFVLAPEVEAEFRSAKLPGESLPALDPSAALKLRRIADELFGPPLQSGALPLVIITAPDIRRPVYEFFRSQFPGSDTFSAVSEDEISSSNRLEIIGSLSIGDEL
ncbi:FHIPEP family type III secretion protein [bacterium]|nr:FHIPEP family type III secretion protein [bacterium]